MTISVVIPVYNGETTIKKLTDLVRKELEGSFSYNIILVTDPGTDNSLVVAEGLASDDPGHIRVISNNRRLGQHGSLLKGIAESTGELIVTMDDDLQHDPAYIRVMAARQTEGNFDVVYAVFASPATGIARRLSSGLFRWLLVKRVKGISPFYSPYRLIKRDTAMKITGIIKPYIFIDGLLAQVAGSYGTVEAEHHARGGGRSAYNLSMLVKHAFNILRYY